MEILVPTNYIKNTYVYQLVNSLQKINGVKSVHTLVPWLFQDEIAFDFIHLQWPESIVSYKHLNNDSYNYINQCLNDWKKKGTKIVSTIHNEIPHRNKSSEAYRFYAMLYRHSDGILHMGEASKRMFQTSFSERVNNNATDVVIKHGNYDCFPNRISRAEARSVLKIPADRLVVASIGAIRSKLEYQLLRRVTNSLKKYDGLLLQIGSINPPDRFLVRHYKRNTIKRKANFRHFGSFVEDYRMQTFLNACDILLVPRVNTLNSGNVALGFTFGKIVMGTASGVIGEELIANGNPVFQNTSKQEISKTIDEAVSMIQTGLGEKNKDYAMTELNWDKLAEKYIAFYKSLK